MIARRFDVPYGLIFQDVMGPSAAQSGIAGGGRVASVTRRLEGWAARNARIVATVSQRFVPYLESIGIQRNRIMHLPNWTHVESARGDRGETRARFGWRDDDVVVLHAGNIGLKQGLDQVLAAAAVARHTAPQLRFALVGDGNQRRRLQEAATGAPNVEFHPFEPEETFPDLLAAADVLLVSERASAVDMSLPSKLTSYFASRIPIVAAVSPSGATAQEITRSGGGLVVPPDRPQDLINAIRDLRTNAPLAHQIAESGLRYCAEMLNADAALKRCEEFVLALTPNNGQYRAGSNEANAGGFVV
jgi:putative colanic acid biosynthesis glycosyltransferase WcaI